MSALNDTTHFKLALRNPTYAVCSKVSVSGLNATQTAQIFIALFLPFSDQILVCIALSDAVLIELSTDGLPLVEEVEDVTAALVVKSEDWPQRLNFTFALMWLGFSFAHFLVQLVESRFYELPPIWRRFSTPFYFRHYIILGIYNQLDAI